MFGWRSKKNKEEFVGTPSKECNSSTTYIDYKAEIKKRQDEERKRKEKWSKELKQKMISNNYTYATSIGHLPGGYTSGTVSTTTRLGDSKVTIDGGENGSMRVDVPLVVNGRDVMKELDEMRDALLLLTRDFNLEEQYPELKQAYDDYMDLHRSIKIADKLAKTGDT